MKMKLNDSQFSALLSLFKSHVITYRPQGFANKLGHALLLQVYAKLYKKAVFSQFVYTVTLTDAEALSFMLFWGNYPLPATMVFETALVQLIINQVHKKYS